MLSTKVNLKIFKSNPELKFPSPVRGVGRGGGVGSQFSKANLKIFKSNPELKFPFPWG